MTLPEDKRKLLNEKLDRKPSVLLISVAVFLCMGILKKLISDASETDGDYFILERFLQYTCGVAGCLSVYSVSYMLSRTKLTAWRVFKVIRGNSLGLYLYSDTWNYVILSIAVGRFGSSVFVTNIEAAQLIFGRIIITFTLALVISTILKALKVKYIC